MRDSRFCISRSKSKTACSSWKCPWKSCKSPTPMGGNPWALHGASMATLARWFRERIPLDGDHLRELTNEPVPNHLKRWWFCLGGTPAYLFVVQIATGILLALYYQPSPSTAYESVRRITEDVSYGWYFRSLHKWAATFMIAAV